MMLYGCTFMWDDRVREYGYVQLETRNQRIGKGHRRTETCSEEMNAER